MIFLVGAGAPNCSLVTDVAIPVKASALLQMCWCGSDAIVLLTANQVHAATQPWGWQVAVPTHV